MIEHQLKIKNRYGLHARPAAKLVHIASRYMSDVLLLVNGEEVDAKSILGVLQLGAAEGTPIRVVCDGEDEGDALTAIKELIDSGFGEMEES